VCLSEDAISSRYLRSGTLLREAIQMVSGLRRCFPMTLHFRADELCLLDATNLGIGRIQAIDNLCMSEILLNHGSHIECSRQRQSSVCLINVDTLRLRVPSFFTALLNALLNFYRENTSTSSPNSCRMGTSIR